MLLSENAQAHFFLGRTGASPTAALKGRAKVKRQPHWLSLSGSTSQRLLSKKNGTYGGQGKAVGCRTADGFAVLNRGSILQVIKAGDVTDPSHFMRTFNGSGGQYKRGQTMTTYEFPKYRRPHSEGPLGRARATETVDDQMPAENLGDLLGRVSKIRRAKLIIGEFQRLRGKLQTDSQRIQREVEEYSALSQQVMQLTKTISESVEKVRASADRPTTERD